MSLLGAVAMRRLRAAWVLLVVAASVLRTSGDLDAAGPSPLLVSLLDGTVQAVDHETGDLLWSFSSGGALVQAHAKPLDGATWDDPPSDSDVIALRKTRGAPAVVFPGVDGALYTLSSESNGDANQPNTKAVVTRLPVTARQLVEASPSMTRDGALVLGSRTSVVFALDPTTGTLLRTFTVDGVVMHGASATDSDDDDDAPRTFALDPSSAKDASSSELHGAVFLGRTEYKVRSVDSRTALERWNVSYGEVLPLTKMGSGGGLFSSSTRAGRGVTSVADDAQTADGTLLEVEFTVDGNTVRSLNSKSQWSKSFQSIPLSAFDRAGVSKVLKRGQKAIGEPNSIGDDEIFVGAHQGGLYALPGDESGSQRSTSGSKSDGLVSFLRYGETDGTQTRVVSVSPRLTEDDWACVPEHLAAAALATKGRVYLDGSIGGTHGALWSSGSGDFDRAQAEKIKVTIIFTLIFGLGVGAAVVAATRAFSDPVFYETIETSVTKLTSETQGKPESNTAETSEKNPDGGKKKRGARGRKRGGRGANDDTTTNESAKLSTEQPAIDAIDATGDTVVTNTVEPVPGKQKGETLRGETQIGRLRVGPNVIGYGSCGTVVFEGSLDGRNVAVKRLLAHFHELARTELKTLIESDEHQNILRCFAMEEDEDFVYVALERCECTLASLVVASEGAATGATGDADAFLFTHPTTRRPTSEGVRLIRDAFLGVNALHAVGVVHRDLKPQNVLVTPNKRGKLADMGLAKKLDLTNGTSFETQLGSLGYQGISSGVGGGKNMDSNNNNNNANPFVGGTAGWLAPERLQGGRQTRAVDLFGLGCLLHYCLTGGGHPFGSKYERDQNVLNGAAPMLTELKKISHEACDLVLKLTSPTPGDRPTAPETLIHPFWWSDALKLQFLCDVSDRVEMEDREVGGNLLLQELERGALTFKLGEYTNSIGGTNTKWSDALPGSLTQNLGKYRSYNGHEIRDLLRVIRNKSNHFRELPKNVQTEVGAPPDAFFQYFEKKFPKLVLHVVSFVKNNTAHEPAFVKYFGVNEEEGVGASNAVAKVAEAITEQSRKSAAGRAAVIESAPAIQYPSRPGAPECVFFVKTGRCKFGERCHFHHPKGLHQQ